MPDPPDPPPKRVSANTVAAPPDDAVLLTFGETAYILRVSVTTVRRLADDGQVRTTRIMGRTLINSEALDDFIRGADLAKKPTSEAFAMVAAQEKVRAEQRMRARVVADWNTGKDPIDLDKIKARYAERAKRKKSKPSA